MITREFIIEKHEEYGELGMRPVESTNFDPLSGMAVAHDILEHFPNDRGTVEDEFQALGASIVVRNENRYYQQKGRIHLWPEQISGDIVDQFQYAVQRGDGFIFRAPPKTQKLPYDIEEGLGSMISAARRLLHDERDSYDEKNLDELDQYLNEEQVRRLRGWFRIGYRRAQKRYRDRFENVYECFNLIEEKADRVLKYAEFDGQRFRIMVNVRQCTVRVTQLDEEY